MPALNVPDQDIPLNNMPLSKLIAIKA